MLEAQLEIRKLKNHAIAVHSQKFFKTGPGEYGENDRFLGIRVPTIRRQIKNWRHLSLEQITAILHSEYHEERMFALLWLVEKFKKGGDAVENAIYNLYMNNTRYINNWDLVDCSAEHIPGAYLFTRDKKPLYIFADSKDLWDRRIAMLATFYFIRKNSFDHALMIAHKLLQDPEDLMHKAVGWMLREIGKRDLETEECFLKKYYRSMPRTMLRYAIEKFPEARRQQYLKGDV